MGEYGPTIRNVGVCFVWMNGGKTRKCDCGCYGVALVSRIEKIVGLFCKGDLLKRRYSAKETYNFIDPTDRSHPTRAELRCGFVHIGTKICMHVYRSYVYKYTYIHKYICMHVYICIYIHICVYIYMHAYIYVYTQGSIYKYIYVHIYVYAYPYMCVCMYAYTYI